MLLLLCGTSALAQGSSVIVGKITNAANKAPLADAVVTATSPSLQGERTVVTDDSGLYRIPQLPPGVYTLRLEREGFRPSRARTSSCAWTAPSASTWSCCPTGLTEEVDVVAAPPTVDVGSSATGVERGRGVRPSIAVIRPGSKGSASRSFESPGGAGARRQEDAYGV